MQSHIVYILIGIGKTRGIKLAGTKQLKVYHNALEQLIQRDVGILIILKTVLTSNFGSR